MQCSTSLGPGKLYLQSAARHPQPRSPVLPTACCPKAAACLPLLLPVARHAAGAHSLLLPTFQYCCPLPTARTPLPAARRWQPAVRYPQTFPCCCLLPAARCPLLVTRRSLSVVPISCRPQSTHCLLLVGRLSPPAACSSWRRAVGGALVWALSW